MKVLPRSFFRRDPVMVARDLLGKIIVRRIDGSLIKAMIVEVEAYLGKDDPAAHGFSGLTNRTKVLFGEAGYVYIYRIHTHFCLNIVSGEINKPMGVLIRAVEPIIGIEKMKMLRIVDKEIQLTNGPGKLCTAMAIDLDLYGADVTSFKSSIFIVDNKLKGTIVNSKRIGVTKAKDSLLRFHLEGNPYVSKK